jgi:molybdopterin-biosynthesis enzyme MoeA-like protein
MTTHFGLIIIGDEILSGKRADKHLPRTIELLAARGLALSFADYVGDDPERITATLARAFAGARESGDVVFSCGGIGTTPDDHTRQCAARAWGRELVLHPEAKALIEERMQDVAKEQGVPFEPDRPDNQHRLNMGVFPKGAEIIPNPYNKIPGFFCPAERVASEFGASLRAGAAEPASPGRRRSAPSGGSRFLGSDTNFAAMQSIAPSGQAGGLANLGSDPKNRRGGIHFVPGFPVMAWPMIEWVLDHHYGHLHQKLAYTEKSVIVMGSMEATLTPLMLAIEAAHRDVKVFSLPSVDHPEYGRHIELGVKGSPESVNRAFPAMLAGLHQFNLKLGPELVR